MMQHCADNTTRLRPRPTRGGFTLVEMLVSVALVLLIMTLFAQAFGIASSSIKKQRGLAENDQRARSMVTVLLSDLQKRTFRQRQDVVTSPVSLPADTNLNNPEDRLTVAVARIENAANQQGQGLVALHPDYFIGGATTAGAVASTQATGGNGAAPREVDSIRERGYLHYSEGDPTNDGDDVLKFTIDTGNTELGNSDTTRLMGRAVALLRPPPLTWATNNPADPVDDVELHIDQPIWDDGIGWVEDPVTGVRRSYGPDETGTTASRLAEVAIFLRDGNLYRRVNLIREPLDSVIEVLPGEGQPDQDDTSVTPPDPQAGGRYFGAASPNYTADSLWNDFDHGVTRADNDTNPLHFTDVASLDNTVGGDTTTNIVDSYPQPMHRYWALGDPRNRFGHDNTDWPVGTNELQGRPKSYMDPTNPASFIGAYTHEETSHPRFRYPGLPDYLLSSPPPSPPVNSPMRWGSLTPESTTDINGDMRVDLLDDFYQGPREGEEILLPNCHAFDVKVWDSALRQFVDIGHSLGGGTPVGDLNIRAIIDNTLPMNVMTGNFPGRFQAAQWVMGRYGGRASTQNRVFDSWHPAFNFTNDVRSIPPGGPGAAVMPDNDPPPSRPLWTDRDSFGADMNALGVHGSFPRFWEPTFTYNFDPATPLVSFPKVFPRPNLPDGNPMPPHMSFFYVIDDVRDLDGSSDFQTGTAQPNWPEAPGATVQDNEIRWKAIPNTIGLRAIQITLRFFDPSSGQMRQLTLTHSFVEL